MTGESTTDPSQESVLVWNCNLKVIFFIYRSLIHTQLDRHPWWNKPLILMQLASRGFEGLFSNEMTVCFHFCTAMYEHVLPN